MGEEPGRSRALLARSVPSLTEKAAKAPQQPDVQFRGSAARAAIRHLLTLAPPLPPDESKAKGKRPRVIREEVHAKSHRRGVHGSKLRHPARGCNPASF